MLPLRVHPELDAFATAYDGARLHFIAPQAFPPGKPLQMTLQPTAADALPLEARSIGSKRRGDGQFDVQARLINLDRGTRGALEQAFPGGRAPAP
jgi:hypothetical protein